MSDRIERLEALQKKLDEFVAREKERIESEVSVLESILSSVTGGRGVQEEVNDLVGEAAFNDLESFME